MKKPTREAVASVGLTAPDGARTDLILWYSFVGGAASLEEMLNRTEQWLTLNPPGKRHPLTAQYVWAIMTPPERLTGSPDRDAVLRRGRPLSPRAIARDVSMATGVSVAKVARGAGLPWDQALRLQAGELGQVPRPVYYRLRKTWDQVFTEGAYQLPLSVA